MWEIWNYPYKNEKCEDPEIAEYVLCSSNNVKTDFCFP